MSWSGLRNLGENLGLIRKVDIPTSVGKNEVSVNLPNSGAGGSSGGRRATGSGDDGPNSRSSGSGDDGPNSRSTTNNADGSSITKYDDGTIVTKDKNGDIVVTDKDGKIKTKDELEADGRNPDGTFKTPDQLKTDANNKIEDVKADAVKNKNERETPDSAQFKALKVATYGVGLGAAGYAAFVALDKYLKKNGKVYNIIAIESVQDSSGNNTEFANYLKDSSGNIIKDPSENFLKDPSGNILKDPSGNKMEIKGITGFKTMFVIDTSDNFTRNGTAKIDETNCNPQITPNNYYITSVISGKKLIIKTDEKVIEKGTKGKMTYYTSFANEYSQSIDEFINGPLDQRNEDGGAEKPSFLGQFGQGLKDILKSLGLDNISSDTINYIVYGIFIFFILIALFALYKMFNYNK